MEFIGAPNVRWHRVFLFSGMPLMECSCDDDM